MINNYSWFAFIEKYSFYQKEKEVLFLSDAVFGIEKIRIIKNERVTPEDNSYYYEITMHLVSFGINKNDYLKFSDSQWSDVCSNKYNEYDLNTINEILKYNTSSKVLYAKNNNIGITQNIASLGTNNNVIANMEKFSHYLRNNLNLLGLNISKNFLGPLGAKLVAEAILNSSNIKWLNISNNQIGNEGAGYLAYALEKNCILRWLDISNNKINDTGAEKISDSLLKNNNLKELDIGNNNISDAGTSKISWMIKVNKTLEWLDISYNKISITGIKALIDALTENKILSYINLWGNMASFKEINKIDKIKILFLNKEIEY